MEFRVDKQTYSDINLFGEKERQPSIYKFYDRTKTIGGHKLLDEMMRAPFSEISQLNNRKNELIFFHSLEPSLVLNKRQVDFIEFYLEANRLPLKNNFIDAVKDKVSDKLSTNSDYYTISEGIMHLSNLLIDLRDFLNKILDKVSTAPLKVELEFALDLIDSKPLKKLLANIPNDWRKLKPLQINGFDNFYRDNKKQELRKVLDTIYKIDVLQALAGMLESEEFCLPDFVDKGDLIFEAVDFMHPLLDSPVKNNFELMKGSSLCLITGPNMSGKSTFLKSIGILTYCAHLGFPLPAKKFRISVFSGLFTTINLSDNLGLGLSHFYAEVSRVKEMAVQLGEQARLVIILDELFRGTNVKDALEATLLVIELLSKIKSAIFFISTHIIEAAEQLAEAKSIDFRCFESTVINEKPEYDYRLKQGITTERVGLQIIMKEGIEELFLSIIKNQN